MKQYEIGVGAWQAPWAGVWGRKGWKKVFLDWILA